MCYSISFWLKSEELCTIVFYSSSRVHLTFSTAILAKLSTNLLSKKFSTVYASISIILPRSARKFLDTNVSLAFSNMLSMSSKQRKFFCLMARFRADSPSWFLLSSAWTILLNCAFLNLPLPDPPMSTSFVSPGSSVPHIYLCSCRRMLNWLAKRWKTDSPSSKVH